MMNLAMARVVVGAVEHAGQGAGRRRSGPAGTGVTAWLRGVLARHGIGATPDVAATGATV